MYYCTLITCDSEKENLFCKGRDGAMNTKTTYSRQEKIPVTDDNTNEKFILTPTASTWADKDFQKVFVKNFRKTLKGVMSQKLQVVLWLMENMTPSNEVMRTYREIAEGSGTSLQTVVRTIETLEKDNFLCRKGRGLIINPDVVFRGRYESRSVACDIYKRTRLENRSAVPDEKEREKLTLELEDAEKALTAALTQVKNLEQKKRDIEKRLAPRRKTGPRPKEEKERS